ncbi:hypothetical protein KC19_8G016400 [Ceratodon purpureus]|uniref:Bifunctional inhibitor/plant lipid transfer protein/seed storage helical domain-containing protein n=1 Tax=Ceratodon purpureus TaxID=3225 RepID=A0A8T0GXH7_CERPU|nr:hypothetical protein KC19_8G016400 [Ceratodon purpureus]
MVKMASSGALLVAMAMVFLLAGSVHAACPAQVPLNCAAYVLDGGSVPSKLCCIEVQNNFNLKTPTSSLQPWCEAVKGVKLYTGQGLTGTELQLALNLPAKCQLSGQYQKGQTCAGKLMSGGS